VQEIATRRVTVDELPAANTTSRWLAWTDGHGNEIVTRFISRPLHHIALSSTALAENAERATTILIYPCSNISVFDT